MKFRLSLRKKSNNQGFTLIELLIATSIFTFILLIATAGIIRIGQLYYKSINQGKTQDTIRAISDELTRSVQFANGTKTNIPTGNVRIERFCLGDTLYTAYLDEPYLQPANPADDNPTNTQSGLWAERLSAGTSCQCVNSTCSVDSTIQLMGQNMRLLNFDISQLASGLDAWFVNIKIAYGDSDLLTHYDDDGNPLRPLTSPEQIQNTADAACKIGKAQNSFCATAQLDTVVKKRLN